MTILLAEDDPLTLDALATCIESEGFKIDRTVYMIVEGENLVTSAKSTGFGLAELATVFNDLKLVLQTLPA